MKLNKTKIAVVLMIMCFGLGIATAAEVITNGDFQNPDITGVDKWVVATGWVTPASGNQTNMDDKASNSKIPGDSNDNQVVRLKSNTNQGIIRQKDNGISWSVSDVYTLTFNACEVPWQSGEGTQNELVVNIKDQNDGWVVLWTTTIDLDGTHDDIQTGDWLSNQTFSYDINASEFTTGTPGGDLVIEFDSSVNISFLDNVSFVTGTSDMPYFTTQPVSQIADVNDSVSFVADGNGPGTLTYSWYKTVDNDNNTPADDTLVTTGTTLQINPVAVSDEGYYYCELSNTTGAVYSDVVSLGVKRMLALWTLDTADYSGGRYLDTCPEDPCDNDADVNGTPSFVNGAEPNITNQGVNLDSSNGYANAGTFAPSEFTNQLTASLWTWWDGNNGQTQVLLSKRDGLASADERWQLHISPSQNKLVLTSLAGGSLNVMSMPENQWAMITVTFDGSAAKVYINGELKNQGSWVLSNGIGADFRIGIQGADYFDGILDDIRVYNYALTQQDIAGLYYSVTGEGVCLNEYGDGLDVTGPVGVSDCKINLYDFAAFAKDWMFTD